MTEYRFALRPRWLLTHVLVAAVAVAMVSLGFWQLGRLDERRARNALIEYRVALPAEPVGDLVDPGDGEGAVDELRFRAVVAEGEYDPSATTAVRATQDGAPGAWVLSPITLPGGEEVVVLRGFARNAPDGEVAEPPPPSGTVDVEGVAVPLERAERTVRSAVDRLAAERPDLLPVLVQAQGSDPPEPDVLDPVPLPELGDGPHLSYAVQWFLFGVVAVVGYPFLLRREARRRAADD